MPALPTWTLMGMMNNPWFRVKVHKVRGLERSDSKSGLASLNIYLQNLAKLLSSLLFSFLFTDLRNYLEIPAILTPLKTNRFKIPTKL